MNVSTHNGSARNTPPIQAKVSGLQLAGTQYGTLNAGAQSIHLKNKANGAVLVKTNQSVVVGTYEAPRTAGETTPVVENLGDFLRSTGH
ncbi:profilin [Streptomyces sp. NRRL S-378]|uniref:profilin n=1 Tax=Streptomyces sp. NRRL S-378 TaxID=1463904 RepID=UPI00099B4281|nr:profilin [Streptomyces sp. NRRL S-378]